MNNAVLNVDIDALRSELEGSPQSTQAAPEKEVDPAADEKKSSAATDKDKASIKALNFRVRRSDLLLLRDLSSKEEKSIQLLIEEGLREVLKRYGKKPDAYKGVAPKKE